MESEREVLAGHLDGLRLFVADLRAAVTGDVKAGTFLLCAAFLDTMALAFTRSAKGEKRKGDPARWEAFVRWAFPSDAHAPLAALYDGYRCRTLHNFGARGVAFTHNHPEDHLTRRGDAIVLDRNRFVDEVVGAFEKFVAEVETNADRRARVLAHFAIYPPMGVVEIPPEVDGDLTTMATTTTTTTERVVLRPPSARSYTGER